VADWEQIYTEKSVADASSAEVLKDNTHLLPASGTALDYASGLAGNGQLLAQLGLAVTAWDYSRVAVEKINQFAAAQDLNLHAEVKDLEQDYPLLSGQFDVICVSCFLHRPSMTRLYDLLAPGGLLFYQTFSGQQKNSTGPSREAFRLRRGELLQTFSAMELLFYREDPQQLEPRGVYSDQVLFVAKK
jgi:2-polyprenyl-3-methyl-5-hydroxy-6-metoxy-1,4-benzoquinol methylase